MYHPTDGGHAYVQVSWPGNVGSLSGFSQQQLAISEIGVSFADDRSTFVEFYLFIESMLTAKYFCLITIIALDKERTTHRLKR